MTTTLLGQLTAARGNAGGTAVEMLPVLRAHAGGLLAAWEPGSTSRDTLRGGAGGAPRHLRPRRGRQPALQPLRSALRGRCPCLPARRP